MLESSKTVGVRKDLIEAAAEWVKEGVVFRPLFCTKLKPTQMAFPKTGFSIPDKRSPWDSFYRMFG
jgi:hypothetical protein